MLIPIVGQQFHVFPQNVFDQNVWFLSETLSYPIELWKMIGTAALESAFPLSSKDIISVRFLLLG